MDYFGARYYDSRLGFWMSVDPLADKNIVNSPYAYCSGNPVMLIDPDGRDVWELNDDGTIKARITDKTQDAIAINGKSISFDYGTIDITSVGKETDGTKYTYLQFSAGKEAEAASAFKFVADNSNVEYALVNTNRSVSCIYTNHNPNEVNTWKAVSKVSYLAGANMTSTYHNHPNGTQFPSGLIDGSGDVGFVHGIGNRGVHYIYPAKANGVVEYFDRGYIPCLQPWPSKDAGNISPYVRQSGIPLFLRKFGIKL